jgi:hypothetical protein
VILWRPVGMRELELIFESGMRTFPPRLPDQPIFYPVLTERYATQIARDWNARTEPFAGYVTRFAVPDSYATKFQRRIVGGREHAELWVPREQLEDFNANILGPIVAVSAFFGQGFQGCIPSRFGLAQKSASQQIQALAATWSYSRMDFDLETRTNELAVFLNFPFWLASSPAELDLAPDALACALDAIRQCWGMSERTAPLVERGERVA